MKNTLKYLWQLNFLSLLIISFLFFPSSSSAEFGTAKYLSEIKSVENKTDATIVTLHEVLRSVGNTNPEIKEAINNYESVRAETYIAKQGYKPTFGTEMSAGPEYTKGVSTNDNRENFTSRTATIFANQNLYKGGGTIAFVKETEARIKAASYQVLNVANEVFSQTAEAYINVLNAREQLEMSNNNVLTQARILKQIKEKIDSGFGRISDLTNSESRLFLAKGNHISRQQTLNQAVTKFHRQYGQLIRPEAFIAPQQRYELPDNVESAVNIAFNNHPALDVAKYNILSRKYSYKRAKAAYLPTIDLELKAESREDTSGIEGETDQASAMIKFKYLFYDGGIRKGETKKSYKNLQKEYERSYVERRNLNETVRLAWNILEAEENKRKFLSNHVKLSKKTLDEFVEEYHLGRRTLLEILDMEKEHYNANSSYIQSKYSFIIAYYQASQAIGSLLHEFDTDILDRVNLLSKKEEFDMNAYDGLEKDKDQDKVNDFVDQCDNSIAGSLTGEYGCSKTSYSTIGYETPSKIIPYINNPETLSDEISTNVTPVLKIDDTKKVQTFTFNSIYFKENSSMVELDTIWLIKEIAGQLKTLDNYSLEVIGHTDNIGSNQYNEWLSKRRAANVVELLLKEGVIMKHIKSSGAGESSPVATNSTMEGRKQNRRTQFKLIRE
ncbi:MAG: TolC family outer membrane protein [Desulfobacteraceae bacterium]|nr:TolC family outer membrane protein [Desulfobacteraceae bacterium]